MFKVTSPAYNLPIIEALSQDGILKGGTTKPLSIKGIDAASGTRDIHYVLKWLNSERLSEKNACNELIGCWIAMELEIPCAEPVLINLSDQFVEQVMGNADERETAAKCVGMNFGSVFIDGLYMYDNQFKKSDPDFLEQALAILVFDLLVDNGDRGQGKPNLFYKNGKLIILDHELIFSSFDLISYDNSTPWLISKEFELYRHHPLLSNLQGNQFDFQLQMDKLLVINDDFWEAVRRHFPKQWDSNCLNRMKERLDIMIENRNIFASEIQNILA